MENKATSGSDSSSGPAAEAEIKGLARETDTPVELVQEVYRTVRARLERTARIKTFVPVLVHRHVKDLLRQRRASAPVAY